MQVKKFEAKSMREALELVKIQLGPDAIILSVRDNSSSYGLVGEGSVEVTAAVSETTLKKKQFAESRLNDRDREKFKKAPARSQREFIERLIKQHTEIKQQKAIEARQMTATPYIQIGDEQDGRSMAPMQNVSDMLAQMPTQTPARQASPAKAVDNSVAMERIRNAARDAWQAGQSTAEKATPSNNEVLILREEISRLKAVIQEFQKVPQKFVSVHPGAEQGIPYELSFMYEKLANAGINTQNINQILFQAQAEIPVLHLKKRAMIDAWVAKHLLNTIQIDEKPLVNRVHAFVGPAGQGKTSMLVKVASHYVVNMRKRVAILTTDSFKVGAADQLRIYAQILNVPFLVLRHLTDWSKTLQQLGNVDHILIDFPGVQLKESREVDFIKSMLPPKDVDRKVHLVATSNLNDSDAAEMGKRFQAVDFTDVMFTCLDESLQHGVIYNFQKQFNKPLSAFGIGPRIPEDFEEATRERVLDLIFKLSRIKQETR